MRRSIRAGPSKMTATFCSSYLPGYKLPRSSRTLRQWNTLIICTFEPNFLSRIVGRTIAEDFQFDQVIPQLGKTIHTHFLSLHYSSLMMKCTGVQLCRISATSTAYLKADHAPFPEQKLKQCMTSMLGSQLRKNTDQVDSAPLTHYARDGLKRLVSISSEAPVYHLERTNAAICPSFHQPTRILSKSFSNHVNLSSLSDKFGAMLLSSWEAAKRSSIVVFVEGC